MSISIAPKGLWTWRNLLPRPPLRYERGYFQTPLRAENGHARGIFPLLARRSPSAKAGAPTSRTGQRKRPLEISALTGLVFYGFAPRINRHAARPGCLGRIYFNKKLPSSRNRDGQEDRYAGTC